MKLTTILFLVLSSIFLMSCGSSNEYDRDYRPPTRKSILKDLKTSFDYAKYADKEYENQNLYKFQEVITDQNRSGYTIYQLGCNYEDSVKNYFKNKVDIYTYHQNYGRELNDPDSKRFIDSLREAKQDSIKLARIEKEKQERKWVYIGDYYGVDRQGNQSYYAHPTYYDINHLLYEGDSICVMLKKTGTGYYSNRFWYQYISINIKTLVVHGIDASHNVTGESYNYVWDGDWWRENSDFANDLYKKIKK
jgi:hypothetical protein